MTYVVLLVDGQRTEWSNDPIRQNHDKTVRSRIVKIGWKRRIAVRREWERVQVALTSGHGKEWPLCTQTLLASIKCWPSQPHGDTTAHNNSIYLYKLIHPLKVSRPLRQFRHVKITESVWRAYIPFLLDCQLPKTPFWSCIALFVKFLWRCWLPCKISDLNIKEDSVKPAECYSSSPHVLIWFAD